MSFIDVFFFFQAEDGIRDVERSRGLGDVYKRQPRIYKTKMDKKRSLSSFRNSLHETFFCIACKNSSPSIIIAIIWLMEKLIVIGQISLQVLSESSQSQLKELSVSLFIVPLFDGEGTELMGVILSSLTIACVGLCLIRILYLDNNSSPTRFIDTALSIFLNLNYRVIIQLLFLDALLLLMGIFGNHSYPDYKHLTMTDWGSDASSHIAQLIFVIFGFLVSLMLSFLFVFLYQSRSMLLWCYKEWEIKLTELGIKLTIFSIFIIDPNDSLLFLSSFAVVIFFGVKIIIRHRLPLPPKMLLDMVDQFFDSNVLIFELIICLSNISSEYSLEKIINMSQSVPLLEL
eukprot:TRINITY_DN43241_c0_g2_i1.p1 TRINITY_DN43241_c0_g2~~TRINITY_DN43241_c0_g2_i1.p1  ORF type:complete len:354 (-),score=25.78 TRINITY_DN43241_c0_g2_i1:46-1077(-)